MLNKLFVPGGGGFDLKPTFPEVFQALGNLGSGKKHSGVMSFSFKSRYMYMSNNICYPLNNINILIILKYMRYPIEEINLNISIFYGTNITLNFI